MKRFLIIHPLHTAKFHNLSMDPISFIIRSTRRIIKKSTAAWLSVTNVKSKDDQW